MCLLTRRQIVSPGQPLAEPRLISLTIKSIVCDEINVCVSLFYKYIPIGISLFCIAEYVRSYARGHIRMRTRYGDTN